VNTAGAPSAAFNGEMVIVHELQLRVTGTVARLFGMKSLSTTIVSLLSVFVIVQVPPNATPAQFAWFAV
jgi:hypothetical protein